MVLIIPIPAKDGLIQEDFKEIQGRDQLKNRHNQFFGLYSDQCVIAGHQSHLNIYFEFPALGRF